MGKFLKPGDSANPGGYYEDIISHALIRTMVAGDNHLYNPKTYLQIMNSLNSGHLSWGVKDPWILYLNELFLKQLQPKLCVVAYRDLKSTVESWIKLWRGKYTEREPPKEVVDHYAQLTKSRQEKASKLQNIWPNIVTVDFSEKVEDAEIVSMIRYGLSSASFLK